MARPNYTAAKRARELKRKAKREAKLARKHARKADQPVTDDPVVAPASDGTASVPPSQEAPFAPVPAGGSAPDI
jgi:hypothetical protein